MTRAQHQELLEVIFQLEGFCAVSGYSNPLYNRQPWDNVHSWDSFCSIDSCAYTDANNKMQLKGLKQRINAEEVLWIKESK
jgi:hypothetical protein